MDASCLAVVENQSMMEALIQFIKYGIAGGLATVVHMFVFFLMAWKVCPALTAKDP